MKTTKKLLSSLYIVALLSAASAGAATEDKAVTYGEKYLCDIQTTDGKTYSLDLAWTAEAKKYSQFPEWNNQLTYSLKQGEVSVDYGSYTSGGFGHGNLDLSFAWDNYHFSGFGSLSTRVGVSTYSVDIKIAKSYDNQTGKTVLAVSEFQSHYEKDHFRGTLSTTHKLEIQSSTCSVVPASKD